MSDTQLALSLTAPAQKPPRRRVRAVSRQAYAEGRERFTGRRGAVLRLLAAFYNLYQTWPTSGELASAADLPLHGERLERLLYVRRGLSDLQRTGNVEAVPKGQRRCNVVGRLCETWRIPSR